MAGRMLMRTVEMAIMIWMSREYVREALVCHIRPGAQFLGVWKKPQVASRWMWEANNPPLPKEPRYLSRVCTLF